MAAPGKNRFFAAAVIAAAVAAACGSNNPDLLPGVKGDGGSSGGSSSSGGSGGDDGSAPGTFGGDAAFSPDAFAACASSTQQAKELPLDLYLMLDTSGSMDDLVADQKSKWNAVVSAMTAFLNDPASAGIGVGLQYFPLTQAGVPTSCTASSQCGAAGPCFFNACAVTGLLAPIIRCNANNPCPANSTCSAAGAAPLGFLTRLPPATRTIPARRIPRALALGPVPSTIPTRSACREARPCGLDPNMLCSWRLPGHHDVDVHPGRQLQLSGLRDARPSRSRSCRERPPP